MHVFERTLGNTIGSARAVPDVLTNIGSRNHFQTNILHVEIDQYHSISLSR